MTLFQFLETKLTSAELKYAEKLYKEETKIFLETLERFRQYFKEELKLMNNDLHSINGIGSDE